MSGNRKIEKVRPRSRGELVREWDALASHREQLISSGRDISYSHVLLPTLRDLAIEFMKPEARVLDVGCGTGTFVTELATDNPDAKFVGIDPSTKSIEIATTRLAGINNCSFKAISIEDYSTGLGHGFDVVIANMLLQNVASLHDALAACVRTMSSPWAVFVFAIPHPCFWPRYWEYEDEPWYSYIAETWIQAPFRTSLSEGGRLRTSHTHRPLSTYIKAFSDVGLLLEDLHEPMPDAGLRDVYPVAWEYPRFMLGRCVRDPRQGKTGQSNR